MSIIYPRNFVTEQKPSLAKSNYVKTKARVRKKGILFFFMSAFEERAISAIYVILSLSHV